MKKTITFILALLFMSSCFYALCVDYDKSFDFSLSAVDLNVNEQGELYVGNGDIITVTLSLNRIDSDASFEMYAMQDEIEYDREFFELVEIGTPAVSGITCTDIARRDRHRAFYMNYLSMVGGAPWVSSSVVGSFRLRVIANSGASVIRSKNCRVSLKDGSDTYYCTSNTITFVVSDNCTVKYNTSGESAVSESVVTRGEKIAAPTSPFRSGYVFAGWFEDIDCKSKWDFSKNTVCENMTLYAGWVENGTSFDDVLATDWFFNDVMYVSLNGLMKGTGQRRFSPHVATTRAMIVTILHRLDGSPDFVDASSFPDITAGAYYEEAVAWAAVNGIVKGYNNGTFGPDDFITREQLATIFFRYAAYKDYKTL